MPAIIQAIISLVTSKIGGIGGFLLKKVLEYGGQALMDAINNYLRSKKQQEAQKKVEDDVKSQAPRNEETRKHEKDWMNS